MRIHKAGHEILSVEDWFRYAPPRMGKLHWKDGRSAKELARSWFRGGNPKPPGELVALLEAKFGTGITFVEVKPERIIELDDFAGEHRNCDLVVLCDVGAKRIVINIEAKADEPFGEVIGEYLDRKSGSRSKLRERRSDSHSKVPERIRQLSVALFGREPDEEIQELRYQLLHAAAATLIEAKNSEAAMGLFLVHEFRSESLNRKRLRRNDADWQKFIHTFLELATASCEKNQILGSVSVPGGGRVPDSVPLYLGKLVIELQ